MVIEGLGTTTSVVVCIRSYEPCRMRDSTQLRVWRKWKFGWLSRKWENSHHVTVWIGASISRQRFKPNGAKVVPTFTIPLAALRPLPHETAPAILPTFRFTLMILFLPSPLGSFTVLSTSTSGIFHCVVAKLNVPSYVSCKFIVAIDSEVNASRINMESTGACAKVMLMGPSAVAAETLNLPPISAYLV